MVKSVFLDTCVFFDCIEKHSYLTIIKTLQNYRIPHELEKVRFFKPKTIPVEEFKNYLK